MEILHFEARVADRAVDLQDLVLARRLWDGLRRAFPLALAAVVLPRGARLVVGAMPEGMARDRLRRVTEAATYGLGTRVWAPLGAATVVRDPARLPWTVRDVVLDPCRRGLVRDPAEWPFSTYRDVMGAAADPWVAPGYLAFHLGWPVVGFAERFHGWVSGDPARRTRGTPTPRRARPSDIPDRRLDELVEATAAAMRLPTAAIERRGAARRLFVGLAGRQGWWRSEAVGARCGATAATVRRIRMQGPAPGLEAAAMCLGDQRLRRGFEVERAGAGVPGRRRLAPVDRRTEAGGVLSAPG